MLYIILFSIIIVGTILLIFTIFYNKFSFAIIKIDEAENNIDVLLQKKLESINRTRPIIKKELKIEEFLDDMDFLANSAINHFDMYNSLKEIYKQLISKIDENDKLLKSEQLVNILDEIKDIEEDINGSIKFYNDNVTLFNKLVVSFPSNIVAFIMRYKKKEFYNNESKEMYEILNN